MGTLLSFLSATPTPMSLSDILGEVTTAIGSIVSWMGSFLSAITTTNGLHNMDAEQRE